MSRVSPFSTLLDIVVGIWKQVMLCWLGMFFCLHLFSDLFGLIQLTSMVDSEGRCREPSMFPRLIAIKPETTFFQHISKIISRKRNFSYIRQPCEFPYFADLQNSREIFSSTTLLARFRELKTLALSKTVLSLSISRMTFPVHPPAKVSEGSYERCGKIWHRFPSYFFLSTSIAFLSRNFSDQSFFILWIAPALYGFHWILAIPSSETFSFWLVFPVVFFSITVVVLFASFLNTMHRYSLFQKLNLRKTFFQATYHFFPDFSVLLRLSWGPLLRFTSNYSVGESFSSKFWTLKKFNLIWMLRYFGI